MITRTDTQTTNMTYARIAGFTFLFYILAGISSMALGDKADITDLLFLLQNLSALVLGVTLYMLTHEQGPALALLALACRILEAVHGESEIFFVVGSTLFCWLLLRGRMIPAALAWLGMIASVLLDVILPLQLAGVLGNLNWSSSFTWMVWLPMLVFEVTFALWLLIKGIDVPASRPTLP